ncbi:MAG: anti-sigma-D factor RsdA [Pseudonocardia sp.]
MGTRPVPLEDVRSEPLDLVAVQADDELINALAGGLQVSAPGVGGYDADDHVAAMLAAWKAEVDAEPIPEIDLDRAVGAVLAGRRPSGRLRHLVPVASAAALIVVAITGVSIAAHDTRPGDALFPISKVLYAQEAASYEALDTVEQSRVKAKEALAVGDKETAEAALAEGQAAAATVLAEHGRGEVEQRLHKLEVAVERTEPGVPTYVEDDEEPARGAGAPQGEDEPGREPPAATSSQEPPSGDDPADAGEPGEPGDPGEPGTEQPGAEPGPDPRSADDPGPDPGPQPDPGADGPPAEQPGSDPQAPAQDGPPATEPVPGPNAEPNPSPAPQPEPGGPSAAGPPATTTAPSADRCATGTGAAAAPGPCPPDNSGISGASMSATGTATPSGQPTA